MLGHRGLQIEGSSLSAELSIFFGERGKWFMPVGGENAFYQCSPVTPGSPGKGDRCHSWVLNLSVDFYQRHHIASYSACKSLRGALSTFLLLPFLKGQSISEWEAWSNHACHQVTLFPCIERESDAHHRKEKKCVSQKIMWRTMSPGHLPRDLPPCVLHDALAF